jgi:dihydroorotate dehydrogenase
VVPVLVKLSPDLQEGELRDALEVLLTAGVEGVVATNTTVGRSGLHSGLRGEAGGLSGRPLRGRATRAVARIYELTQGTLPIIAVGGVLTAQDVREKLAAGASLVQVYTGLVYRGPGLIREALGSLRGWRPPSCGGRERADRIQDSKSETDTLAPSEDWRKEASDA